jgi:predicted nucleic-acid-binding protein
VIAVDTNVLLRYLLRDDKDQAAKADKLILGDEPVLVTDVVLVEALWTLKGPKYKASKDDLLTVMDGLFREPSIHFEDAPTVWRAYHDYRLAESVKVGSKRKSADLADALIVHKAKLIAKQVGARLDGVYTFDVAAREIDGTKEPK